MVVIQKYDIDTQSQIEAYINVLHRSILEDERSQLILTAGEDCIAVKSGDCQNIKDYFLSWYKREEIIDKDIFITVNEFNAFVSDKKTPPKESIRSIRSQENLYSFDLIMLDIDALSDECSGREQELIDKIFAKMEEREIPIPTAFSFSGSGGVHLYYSFDHVLPSLSSGVKGLTLLLSCGIRSVIEALVEEEGLLYKLDTDISEVKNDRLSGTVNTKTNKMCEFFSTNAPLYTFGSLLGCDKLSKINWSRFCKKCRKLYYHDWFEGFRIDMEEFRTKKRYIKMEELSEEERNQRIQKAQKYMQTFQPVAERRVQGILALGRSGYGFYRRRERTCFFFRQMCRQAGYSRETEVELLKELNTYFHKPFTEDFLLNHTDSAISTYRVTNEVLAEELGIEVGSKRYKLVFGETADKKKELTPKQLKTAKRYIMIANLKISEPELSITKISARTGIGVDAVKRINSQLNKDAANLSRWAKVDCTKQEDKDFVKEYLTENPLYGEYSREYHRKKKQQKEMKKKVEELIKNFSMENLM